MKRLIELGAVGALALGLIIHAARAATLSWTGGVIGGRAVPTTAR